MRHRDRLPWRSNALVRLGALVVVAAWGLYQTFWNLTAANIVGDESIYVRAGWAYVHGDFTDNREHPPTAKYLFGLAQLLFGPGVLGPRIVVGLLVVAGAVSVFLVLRRHLGFWAGLSGAALLALTPRGNSGARIDRLALLDPVMALFALLAVLAAWTWIRSDRWWLAPVSGALMALSVTSKVSTAVLLPAFLLLPVLFRAWRRLVVGGALWAASFGLVFVGLYLPMGMRSAIRYMLDFQNGQNTHGHPIVIDGHVYVFAPWWANLWYFVHGVGPLMTAAIVIGLVAALTIRPDRLVVFVASALALITVFYIVIAKIALPMYYEGLMPPLLVLVAIGHARIATLRPRVLGGIVATVLGLLVLIPSAQLSATIAAQRPEGIARLDGYLRDHGRTSGPILFVSATGDVYDPYFPRRGTMVAGVGALTAIVVGTDDRYPPSTEITSFLSDTRAELRRADLDGLVVWTPRDDDARIVERDGALELTR